MPHPEAVKSHCPLDHSWVLHMWGILGRRESSFPKLGLSLILFRGGAYKTNKMLQHLLFKGRPILPESSQVSSILSHCWRWEAKAGHCRVSYLSLTQGTGDGTRCPPAPSPWACSWGLLHGFGT